MATRFVSNTTSNGYTAGTDSGTALAKGTPWLTITFALSTANAGDTITVNGGTYLETAFLNPGKINFTLTSDGSVIVQTNTGADTKVLSLRSAASGFILNTGFTFDSQGVQASCISSDGTGGTFTLHGPQVINYTTQGFSLLTGTWVIDQGWSASSVPTAASSFGMVLNNTSTSIPASFDISNGTIAPGVISIGTYMGIRAFASANCSNTVKIYNNTITLSVATGNNFCYGISPNSNRVNSTIYSNTINITTTVSSGDTVRGIYLLSNGIHKCYSNTITITAPSATTDSIQGIIAAPGTTIVTTDNIFIENNTISIVGTTTSTSPNGIAVNNIPTAGNLRSLIINWNNITLPAGAGSNGGVSIKVGNDTGVPTTKNTLGFCQVIKNSINGGSVGILFGNVNNVTSQFNDIKNCVVGIKDRLTNQTTSLPCYHYKNKIYLLDGTGAAMQSLAANATTWDSNYIILDVTGQSSKFIDCNADSTAPTASTNCIFKNNVLLGAGNAIIAASCASNTGSTSNCTFTSNIYFALNSFATNAWNYQGTSYANLVAWLAVEATALAIDPRARTLVN